MSKWKLHEKASYARMSDAVLNFRRQPGPLPSVGAAFAVAKHVDEFRKSTEFTALADMRRRSAATEAELATAQREYEDLKEQLACDPEPDTAASAVRARDHVAALQLTHDAITANLPAIDREARASYAALLASVSSDEMAVAAPGLRVVMQKIESAISPLLDELFAARGAFDRAGKGLPSAESILGPELPAQAPPAPQRVPILPNGTEAMARRGDPFAKQPSGQTPVAPAPYVPLVHSK